MARIPLELIFNLSLIYESLPSLLISIIGLTACGKKLDEEQNKSYTESYPLLLLSTCMIDFKGNAELIYAMHLSSYSQKPHLKKKEYLKFSILNGFLVMAQSIAIGFSIGLIGFARNIFTNLIHNYEFLIRILSMCSVAAIISSLILLIGLIPTVYIAVKFGINPDHMILPVISSVGDYVDIFTLVCVIKLFEHADILSLFITILIIIICLPILVYISIFTEQRVPLQSILVMTVTYLLSTMSSYAVQSNSKKYTELAASTPIFCGLSGSIAHIYLSKDFTYLQTPFTRNRRRDFHTLLFIALVIGLVVVTFMSIIGIVYKFTFVLFFLIFFVLCTFILLKSCGILVKLFLSDLNNLSVVSLPIITSLADFFGTISILIICILMHS